MGKVTKLEKAYDEIDKEYSNATPEQMQEKIKKMQEEIEKNKGILAKMENAPADKKEPFEKGIKDLEQKITNMMGYSKNRAQIHKIKDYRANLEKKLLEETKKKASCEKSLEKVAPELEKVLKQLKDEKYTMKLDQYQYNDLLQKKEDLTKEVKENKDGKDLASKRIIELQSKIGKCDLAWKTLFTNKDWDEIQRRAMSDEKRFTRKVDEKHPPIKSDEGKKEEKNSIEADTDKAVEEEIANNVNKIIDEEKEKNLPAPLSRWDKIKNFFKGIQSKIKSKFSQKEDKEEIEKAEKVEKEEKVEKDEKEEDYKNEKRDKFLEGLRQYADDEYRQQVKQEKERAYIESHKVKSSEEKTTEDKGEELE